MERKLWKLVNKVDPPVGTFFWGYDVFYSDVHICEWDGEDRNDDGEPSPGVTTVSGDDYSIGYWMEKEKPPAPPNVCLDE